MSLLKWFSLGLAAVSAVLTWTVTALIRGPEVVLADGGWLTHSLGAIIVGGAIGMALWLICGAYERELRRLSNYVEALAHADDEPPAFDSRFGLRDLARAIHRTLGAMQQRLKAIGSQRRELEVQARLAEAERRHLEAILNAITDAVIVTDAFNEIVLANEAAGRILNFQLDSALRRPVDAVIHDPTLVKLIRDTREGGHAALRRHVEHRLGVNGQAAVFDVTLACVSASPHATPHTRPTNGARAPAGRNPGDGAAGVVTILRDITREKEIAEMKSDFVSNVSHELRTPLSSIKACMEMLVDGEAQDEATRAEFYNIIQGETNRLSRLIDNILNISRIESGVVKVQREHIALPQLIREAVDVMQPQARAKRIALHQQPCPLFFQIFADRDMIYQSILNLISNAIKYTPEGGKVTVSLSVDEHERMVTVAVADTGVGIPGDDLPHLFDKFYRVADHKKLAKGTGLGLNLVKHVIETVHGGKVGVESEAGKGSTFMFSLPIADNG